MTRQHGDHDPLPYDGHNANIAHLCQICGAPMATVMSPSAENDGGKWWIGNAERDPLLTAENDVDHGDFVIAPAGDGHDAFIVTHGPCAERLLLTQVCHLDTLVRIAAEHTCPIPPG
jgi:hypothetical protein